MSSEQKSVTSLSKVKSAQKRLLAFMLASTVFIFGSMIILANAVDHETFLNIVMTTGLVISALTVPVVIYLLTTSNRRNRKMENYRCDGNACNCHNHRVCEDPECGCAKHQSPQQPDHPAHKTQAETEA